MYNDHCHRVSTHLQLINIIIIKISVELNLKTTEIYIFVSVAMSQLV
jgi:hypothetical protein